MLRLKKNIIYHENDSDIQISYLININAWVSLINSYFSIQLENYTIMDLLQHYADNKIEIKSIPKIKYKQYGDVKIYNATVSKEIFSPSYIYSTVVSLLKNCTFANMKNFTINAILHDENYYTDSDLWYVTFKDKIVNINTNLYSEDKLLGMSIVSPILGKDCWYSQAIFTKFCFDYLGVNERYSFFPKPTRGEYLDRVVKKFNLHGKNKPQLFLGNVSARDIGNDIIKYTRYNDSSYTIKKIKEYYYK